MPTDQRPLIVWFRRDLRLTDHGALFAAVSSGRPIIPVFIADRDFHALGSAAKWRFGLALAAFARALEKTGSKLIYRTGEASVVLAQLVMETDAAGVHWQRRYDPIGIACDKNLKSDLQAKGITAESHSGFLLIEPWEIATKTGGYYKVFTPFWRNLHQMKIAPTLAAPEQLRPPANWPESENLDAWQLGRAMMRGANVVIEHLCIGEAAAQARLEAFLTNKAAGYATDRDFPAIDATSSLSENLTYGEISPRQIWHQARMQELLGTDVTPFLRQLAWRDFAWHLAYHTPHILTQNWKTGWDSFPWRTKGAEITVWQRGQTGIAIVDAAMRELFVTGRMHNRARMLAASYLTKHLLVDWRVGQRWFADTLVDWDQAANAMGWQWVAGCGPDASPYFRIFNPDGQAEKFDKSGAYQRYWLKGDGADDFYAASPVSWRLSPKTATPYPLISLADGRARALEAYAKLRSA